MRKLLGVVSVLVIGLLAAANGWSKDEREDASGWTKDFAVGKDELASAGRNLLLALEPGDQMIYEGDDERLVITVLPETKVVDGVQTRIVEERETKGGNLVEVSRNYFAISKRTSSVFYFGEEVDIYKNGKVVDHEGAWQSGLDNARFGMMMPGDALLGARYYQEIAPDKALDRAQIVGLSETVKTPAGEFKNCVKIEETTPLEPGTKEYKYYAPGVGLVQDGDLKLVKHQKAERRR
jgi:hypothetical protein